MDTPQHSSRGIPVTLIPGDGIGPEVTGATRLVIAAAGVNIDWIEREAGAEVFRAGLASGVPDETIDSIAETGVALKGPLETPVGYGEKSANVTLRKFFETYGNVRPARELPGIATPFSGRGVDLVVVRENVEDLYAGIEHMQTEEVAQSLKIISRKGCEKIVRLAFEFARMEGRRKVHCATKSNILKMTEGMLKRTFEEVAPEYDDIEAEHIIVDNCAHQLVIAPEQFDVIVTTNMNGDILSDLTSGLVGGLGVAPSANIGNKAAIFEAVHGSAPSIAGKNIANPTAMMLTAVMMLRHLGQYEAAWKIEHAVMLTLQNGINLTADIVGPQRAASTIAFTDTVIKNLHRVPEPDESALPRSRGGAGLTVPTSAADSGEDDSDRRRLVGVDVFVEFGGTSEELGTSVLELTADATLKLRLVSNRGLKVFPGDRLPVDCVDAWGCRFLTESDEGEVTDEDVIDVLRRLGQRHRWVHVEKLQMFDGVPGFSRDQGDD